MLSAHTSPLARLGGWETGGMNVYVRELGRELGQRGVAVDVFTRRQTPDLPDCVEYAPNARVVHLDAGPQRPVDKYDVLDYLPELACGVQRWRALTGLSYDLIHGHYWLSGRLGMLFRERWGVPLVTMFHTLGQLKNRVAESAAETEQQIRYDIERRTMAASDRIVAATTVDRAQIVRHYGALAAISVIPGGVDLGLFRRRPRLAARRALGLADDARVLLFVGRIQRLKGVEVLLRAVAELRRDGPGAGMDLRVVLVGGLPTAGGGRSSHEGREIARLRRLAATLGVADRTAFVGAVPQAELPRYYSAADVTVMPSSYESFGLVAAESLACGTPVVATRVGGLTTIVRDGETGYLVPWRDPVLFADRLRELLTNEPVRARMAARARGSVERFAWGRIAEAHIELYQELLEARSAAPAALGASG
jgi:D-inositol-3-phosphate glycosyltransferase